MDALNNKPKIYGYCPAGCKWETVHRDEFLRSASHIGLTPNEDGSYHLEQGKEYKIFAEKDSANNFTCSVELVQSDGKSYSIDLSQNEDKYAESFTFRLLEVIEHSTSGNQLSIVYELAGARYATGMIGLFNSATIRVTGATSVCLYNADATVYARDGASVFIRYSANEDGTDFAEEWAEGQKYIGFGVGYEAPTDKEDYTWYQIVYDELSQDVETLKTQVADLMYVPIAVESFTSSVNTVEKGITVTETLLSWVLNKIPERITIGSNEPTPVKTGSLKLENLEITKNHDLWIVATDERGTQASKKVTINFYNGVYYGVSAIPETYDSAFIIALGKSGKKTLRSSKLSPFSVTAGEGEYIYYCLPKSMGACSFKVGGFDGGFELVATLEDTDDSANAYENEHGHREAYYIYRSTNAGLGATTVEVK